MSVAVVGGGFTGVEVAGAILDLFKETSKFYSQIGPDDARVHLIEGGPSDPGPASRIPGEIRSRENGTAAEWKSRRESELRPLKSMVIRLAGDQKVVAGTVISAVGNGTHPLIANSGLPVERGRLTVTGRDAGGGSRQHLGHRRLCRRTERS